MAEDNAPATPRPPPIFIISGGAGALGKHVARIALSQFPHAQPDVVVIPQVRLREQLTAAVEQAAARGAMIIHTMVNPEMRDALLQLAAAHGLAAVDTVSATIDRMAQAFGDAPLGQPGLYHGDEEAYLERIKAIEYTVDHDDGRRPEELHEADVVLTGVSRVGKTPLSIFLSVLGWKVANVPLVIGVAPPAELFRIDRRRVIGLVVRAEALAEHRHWRQRKLRGAAGTAYTQLEALYEELDMARKVFRRGGFATVDVTGKPVEESADDIIARITVHFERKLSLPQRTYERPGSEKTG